MTQQNKGSGMFRKLFVTAWLLMAWLCGIPAMAAPSLTAMATPASAVAPASVTLSVIVNTDPDPVTVTQVEYFNGSTSLGMATSAPFSLALINVAAGTYAIVAQATLADPQNPVLISAPTPLTVTGSTPGANVYYIQTDQLNTPRAITDQSNALVWKWESDPFGSTPPNERPSTAPNFVFNPRLPGQVYDSETGIHYNYHRDYDPQTGRYIESDPIGLKGGINTYAYVGDDPIRFIDPRGLSKFDKFFGLPKQFWNWAHKADKGGRGYDYAEQEAKDLYEEWLRQGKPKPDSKGRHRQDGFVEPDLFEWLVPWWLTPSDSGCSDMSEKCKAERKRREEEVC
jgi:RHS repeat-associated protein